jgi:hypothetical protein
VIQDHRSDEKSSVGDGLAKASCCPHEERKWHYGQLDKSLAGKAYYITWLWDNQVNFASKDVNGIPNAFNGNSWDLTFSSLK